MAADGSRPPDASAEAADRHYFMTVDAETTVIREGIVAISAIRDKVEAREHVRIPIVWFVRFQRRENEYIEIDSPEYFAGPCRKAFDCFELAKAELLNLAARGDEIGWHYHPYTSVYRTDLSHAHRMKILATDLTACAAEMQARHPYFQIRSFRFGWFFIPDFEIFTTLHRVGIRADASIRPGTEGRRVKGFDVHYLPALTVTPKQASGISLFPYRLTHLIHDFQVVPRGKELDPDGARRNQDELEQTLLHLVAQAKQTSGSFTTYQTVLASHI